MSVTEKSQAEPALLLQTNDKAVQRIIIIEGLANLIVLAAKTIVGTTTGSLAIIGDALHSVTDVANNIVALAVIKHASKPADKEHPYGHRKFETLAVLGLAVLLVVLAFELALHAIRRDVTVIVSSNWELGVMLGVLTVNFLLASWQRGWAKKLNSDLLHADASHTFADVLTTIVVIGGWQLSSMGYVWLDQLCAFAVALLIFYLAFQLFKKVAPVLVDGYAIDPKKLSDKVVQVDGVEEVNRVRSRWIGNIASIDMIISVANQLTTEESHQICDNVERLIEKEFEIADVSIHVEPINKSS